MCCCTIPKEISLTELLVRYVYDKNFKRKIIEENNFISKDVFLPNKGGVSLQRYNYCNENNCKLFAKKIPENYVGFLLFRKSQFEEIKQIYISENREEFDACIISSPIDAFGKLINDEPLITTKMEGNPSHADLIYLNPAVRTDETPNIAIRSFSRKLAKICTLVIDPNPNEETYSGASFITFAS